MEPDTVIEGPESLPVEFYMASADAYRIKPKEGA